MRNKAFWNSLIGALWLLLAVAVWLALPKAGKSQSGRLLARLRAQGFVRVGYADEAPFAYIDPRTGQLTGESPTVLRIVMKKLGVPHVRGVLTQFGSLIPGLEAHRFDIIAAGMYITPARAKEILFSNPTFGIGDGLVVREGNPLHLHSYRDIARKPTVRLGIVAGAQEYHYALESGIKSNAIDVYPSAAAALAAVESGRIDAYAGTALTVRRLVRLAHNADITVARPFTNPVIHGAVVKGYGAFGFRKSNKGLCLAVDRVLSGFVGSPEHLALVKPFGFTASDMPGDVTANKLESLPR